MAEERRRFSRVPFKVNTEVAINDVVYRVDEIINLSVGGCLLPIKADLASGTPCDIKIFLSGTDCEMSIRIDGVINRRDGDTVAVRFARINPESLIHLQNIVRYNSPDADVIESEIVKNPGIF
jgi:hypothetical protein